VLAVVSEPWASGSDEPWAGWLAATSLGLAAVSGWLAATVERRADGRACRQRPTSSWLAVAGERWVAATCRTGAASSRCTEERERESTVIYGAPASAASFMGDFVEAAG
jgi:hypothetical protein